MGQHMEDGPIRQGFGFLRPGRGCGGSGRLYEAALCRAKADWLAGCGTWLFSHLFGKTLSVGRVMAPILALVEQEAAISSFKKEGFIRPALVLAEGHLAPSPPGHACPRPNVEKGFPKGEL